MIDKIVKIKAASVAERYYVKVAAVTPDGVYGDYMVFGKVHGCGFFPWKDTTSLVITKLKIFPTLGWCKHPYGFRQQNIDGRQECEVCNKEE